MRIETEADLERAMTEYQRLDGAAPGSPEEKRRRELDAEIKAFSAIHQAELKPAKPEGSVL